MSVAKNYIASLTDVSDAVLDGEPVLRVVKTVDEQVADIASYAKAKDIQFHNGTIEVKMYSRLLPTAPAHARGFIGIAYRISEDDTAFESFYVRPTNGRGCTDPVRKAHGCQYFSYPKYDFAYFRDNNITDYEAPNELALHEWITLKAVIRGEKAAFYLNGSDEPVLTVDEMKHGAGEKGAVGLFVDIGTEGFFKDLVVTCED